MELNKDGKAFGEIGWISSKYGAMYSLEANCVKPACFS